MTHPKVGNTWTLTTSHFLSPPHGKSPSIKQASCAFPSSHRHHSYERGNLCPKPHCARWSISSRSIETPSPPNSRSQQSQVLKAKNLKKARCGRWKPLSPALPHSALALMKHETHEYRGRATHLNSIFKLFIRLSLFCLLHTAWREFLARETLFRRAGGPAFPTSQQHLLWPQGREQHGTDHWDRSLPQ